MTDSRGAAELPAPPLPIDLSRTYAGRRTIVLGASGFLGRWTARALAAAGASVVAVVRDGAKGRASLDSWRIDAELVELDLLAPDAPAAIVSLGGDVVFNLVGYGVDRAERDEAMAERTNVTMVRDLADAIARTGTSSRWNGVSLLHVGSALEYGLVHGILAEEGEVRPHTTYGRTKLEATRAIQSIAERTGARLAIARLFTVYGAGEHETRLLPTLVRAARDGTDVSLSAGLQRRDFAAADEAAEGMLRLAASSVAPGAVVNVASGRLTRVRDFANVAATLLSIPSERLRFGSEEVRSDEMDPAGVAIDRLRAATGWAPSGDLAEGIARMIDAGRA